MITRYLVKTISVATEDNPNFAGQTAIAFYGKRDKRLSYQGDHAEKTHSFQKLWDGDIKEYGYRRVCDARRNYWYTHPENTKNWESVSEIVEFTIDL